MKSLKNIFFYHVKWFKSFFMQNNNNYIWSSMRKYSIVTTYSWSDLFILFPGVVHLSKPWFSCQNTPSHPNSVSLIGIIKHLNIDGCWLYKNRTTLVCAISSYFLSLSLTLSLTLLSSLSLNPLKRVDPPERQMLLYKLLLVWMGQSWITLSTNSSTDFLYFSSTISGLKNISGAKNLSGPTDTLKGILEMGSTP